MRLGRIASRKPASTFSHPASGGAQRAARAIVERVGDGDAGVRLLARMRRLAIGVVAPHESPPALRQRFGRESGAEIELARDGFGHVGRGGRRVGWELGEPSAPETPAARPPIPSPGPSALRRRRRQPGGSRSTRQAWRRYSGRPSLRAASEGRGKPRRGRVERRRRWDRRRPFANREVGQPFATRFGRGARARVEAGCDVSATTQLRPFALAS